MMQREQFTFYRSFFEGVSRIKNKQSRCDAYDAIVRYALDGVEPDLGKLSDSSALAFVMAKPNLDASRKKAEAGRKGGESDKQTRSKAEANGKQTVSKPQARDEEANRKQDKEQDKDKDKEQMLIAPYSPPRGTGRLPAPRFVPPSVDDVRAYCEQRKNGVDPEQFVNFYASKGWKVGNSPMKDWRAAVRTWEKRNDRGPGTADKPSTSNPFLAMAMTMEEDEE